MPTDKPQRQNAQRRRLDGAASRARIVDAAAEIAAERGYEGTGIAAVSAKCGLPASSIYWHFKDKDDLIAAVIERSYHDWLRSWQLPDEGSPQERLVAMVTQIAKALSDSPDFLRLGLMLSLERRPVEPRARSMFLEVRAHAVKNVSSAVADLVPGLTAAQLRQLSTYAVAGADGLFIAKEIDGDALDLVAMFEQHALSLYGLAHRMASQDTH
ncbi:TetR/AcrR family transcriptional regulator [Mycobacterium sp. D16R24]|uniref:TetR/AcrR family transcriptional regulator n=1 Tax=Mycobacterium sp. D16R24 TaxID=1855656 RepID=UPI0009921BB5|nr:TetR/AcrR family transcriptional regulator [Mycobacterium sp. D16R24]